jgi:two-component system, NtrC family, sensor kinase
MPQSNVHFLCQVLEASEAGPTAHQLKNRIQLPAEFIESVSEFKTDSGIVWIIEVVQKIPKINIEYMNRPPLVLIIRGQSTVLYKQAVSALKPDVILADSELSNLNEVVEKLQAQLLIRSKKRTAERSVTLRNKELQTLALDLEKMVEERTLWIESSNREQKELIKNERQFVQFLIEISLKQSQEEALLSFKDQFRKMQMAQEVFLLQDKKLTLILKGEKIEHNLPHRIWKSQDIESLSEDESRMIAKVLSRPVGRLFVFPLPLFENQPQAGLVIEKVSVKSLNEFHYSLIKKYVQAVGLSFQKIKLEETNRVSALRWEKVFDGALDPVAILTENFDVIRSNKSFDQNLGKQKCYEIWANRTEPCENCPMLNSDLKSEISKSERLYQVMRNSLSHENSDEDKIYLHRYVDVTETRQAHIRFIQNEKLSSIGQIAEQMAHEIYNPLAGIIALVQILLLDKNLEESTRQDLEEIGKAAVRAQKVIENLQDFVREESDLTLSNLDEIVDKTLPLLKMKWRSYRLDLQLNASTGAVLVQPQLISQVVYNLIQNSCQAMEPGQTLSIQTRLVGNMAQLIVEDFGVGIPEHLQGSIFKPFFTTKSLGEGTGLGLSLSKQIAERFNGRLYFQSKVGRGTQFYLELPLVKNN